MAEFTPWPKTPRLFRNVVITEKIDGTNAAVVIEQDGERVYDDGDPNATAYVGHHAVYAQSRNRFITPDADNHGFAAWVQAHADQLVDTLGPGRHFGEWWGRGIQRGYGVSNKRFSLFNTAKWELAAERRDTSAWNHMRDAGLGVVPVLHQGVFSEAEVRNALTALEVQGSFAAPGFMQPEGVVVHHSAAGRTFKVLLDADETPKSAAVFVDRLPPALRAA